MEDAKLYTTAEIMLATGLPRGTITNRAKALGFDRTGMGYTADQVVAMIMRPMHLHRRDEKNADELRGVLNERLKEMGAPMQIVPRADGSYTMQYAANNWQQVKDFMKGVDGR